ncbi:MAG: hypothetical protein R3D02_14150 [Hyphomicrobiales bacterium]
MAEIQNDTAFRKALDGLDIDRQRKVGAMFVRAVLPLIADERVTAAVDAAERGASGDMLSAAFQGARRASIDWHTRCGAEGDWKEQAAYFVARAAAALVAPPAHVKSGNPAWQAAVNARMARTSLSIDGEAAATRENEAQYRILAGFLNA